MAARAQHSGPAANGGGAPALLPLLLLLLSAAAIIPRGTALPGPARRGRLAALGVGAGGAGVWRSGAVRAGERPGRGFHGSGRSLLSVCPSVRVSAEGSRRAVPRRRTCWQRSATSERFRGSCRGFSWEKRVGVWCCGGGSAGGNETG